MGNENVEQSSKASPLAVWLNSPQKQNIRLFVIASTLQLSNSWKTESSQYPKHNFLFFKPV